MNLSGSDSSKTSNFSETAKIIVQALLIALAIRTFLFQPFVIPSGSMKNTLLVGDYLFVSKYSYGYSRYSFPFGLAPFSGRIWGSKPERGDVAVFKRSTDASTDYIKRVIGLPGDTIQMVDGILHINGEAVERERITDFIDKGPFGNVRHVPRYRETLPNGVSYDTLDMTPVGQLDNTRKHVVPDGHYFMMGDNRDVSHDSRVFSDFGVIPLTNFIGRAEVLFFSIDKDTPAWKVWTWPWTVKWNRIGKVL